VLIRDIPHQMKVDNRPPFIDYRYIEKR